MRLTDRRVIAMLATVLAGIFWSDTAHAAHQCYVTIEGATQGKFKGEGSGGDTGRIACLQFSYQAKPQGAAREAAPRQASAKSQPASIVIVKQTDSASPQLRRALLTGELLKHVTFDFVRAAADGREQVYKTLRLTDASVASVRQIGGGGDQAPREEVTFVFQEVEATGTDGKALPIEHWVGIRP